MNEELDELASAYVDGEASAEEIARVEGDPALLSLVEEFRALRQSSVADDIDPDRREQHISAALAAFDEIHGSKPSQLGSAQTAAQTTAPPTSQARPHNTSGTTDHSTAQTGNVTSLEQHRARRRGPAWLLNAAAAVVVVGGIGFAVTQLPEDSGNDAAQVFDETELEEEAADLSSASGAEQEADAAASGSADGALSTLAEAPTETAGESEDDDAMADDAMADDDESADAMADEAMEDEAMEDGADQATEEGAVETTPAVIAVEFDGTETASEILASLASTDAANGLDITELLPADQTDCFAVVDVDGEPLGFFPVLYGGELTHLLVFDVEGTMTPALVNESCVVLSTD